MSKLLKSRASLKARAEEKTRFLSFNDHGVSTMDALVGIAISVIVLVAVFSLAPVIGSNIDAAVDVPAGSQWNTTENTDLTTGADIWGQFSGLLILVGMISLLSLAIWAIMRLNPGGDV